MGATGFQPRGQRRQMLNIGAFFKLRILVTSWGFRRLMGLLRRSLTLSDLYRALISCTGAAACIAMPLIFPITNFTCLIIVLELLASRLPAIQSHSRARAGNPTQILLLLVLLVMFFQVVQTTARAALRARQKLRLASVLAEYSAPFGAPASTAAPASYRRYGCQEGS